jgi:hypothetical protein
VHVFVAWDVDGTEGVPAVLVDGVFIPLIAADAARLTKSDIGERGQACYSL